MSLFRTPSPQPASSAPAERTAASDSTVNATAKSPLSMPVTSALAAEQASGSSAASKMPDGSVQLATEVPRGGMTVSASTPSSNSAAAQPASTDQLPMAASANSPLRSPYATTAPNVSAAIVSTGLSEGHKPPISSSNGQLGDSYIPDSSRSWLNQQQQPASTTPTKTAASHVASIAAQPSSPQLQQQRQNMGAYSSSASINPAASGGSLVHSIQQPTHQQPQAAVSSLQLPHLQQSSTSSQVSSYSNPSDAYLSKPTAISSNLGVGRTGFSMADASAPAAALTASTPVNDHPPSSAAAAQQALQALPASTSGYGWLSDSYLSKPADANGASSSSTNTGSIMDKTSHSNNVQGLPPHAVAHRIEQHGGPAGTVGSTLYGTHIASSSGPPSTGSNYSAPSKPQHSSYLQLADSYLHKAGLDTATATTYHAAGDASASQDAVDHGSSYDGLSSLGPPGRDLARVAVDSHGAAASTAASSQGNSRDISPRSVVSSSAYANGPCFAASETAAAAAGVQENGHVTPPWASASFKYGPPPPPAAGVEDYMSAPGSTNNHAASLRLLQQHIDELTGEKLELLRGLQQQSKLNENLQEEHQALGDQYNSLMANMQELRQKVRTSMQTDAQCCACVVVRQVV